MRKLSEALKMGSALLAAGRASRPVRKSKTLSLGRIAADTARRQPDAPFCFFEGSSLSWGEFDRHCNRLAHFFKACGVHQGDTLGLLMENRPDFLALCVALSRIGARPALINTSIRRRSLLHCLETTNAQRLVFGSELAEAVEEIRRELPQGERTLFCMRDRDSDAIPESAIDLATGLQDQPATLPEEAARVRAGDTAFYIFTSGTTGLPKASIITNERWLRMARTFTQAVLRMSARDRIYQCLPLYHANGMYIGFGSVALSGGSMFLRRHFSASAFLDEAREYQTNRFVYIGEICRYLLNQPPRPDDGDNPLAIIAGNGLRPDIWTEFRRRFNIPRIVEFYGATEGNGGCINLFNRDETVGFCAQPHAVIRFDVENEEVIRNQKNRCERVTPGDTGLMIMRISPLTRFDGYTDREATEKKILRDVFRKGDAWFNTGDLLRQVDVGFALGLPHYQFIDRVGDTFRWKGENVSTNEVAEILNQCDEIHYCNVYGVEIPGADGRAGMAALVPERAQPDMEAISRHVRENLPSFARPVFLRVTPEMETTGTFKLKKTGLRKEGYDPAQVEDPLYVLKPGREQYEPLDDAFYQRIREARAGY